MKASLAILTSIIICFMSLSAFADPPINCYTYEDANLLAYCTDALPGGKSRISFPDQAAQNVVAGTNQLFYVLNNTQTAPIYYSPYSTVAVYGAEPNPVTAFVAAASDVLYAAAWAYNWKHGYVSSRGIYAASYLMNYPW